MFTTETCVVRFCSHGSRNVPVAQLCRSYIAPRRATAAAAQNLHLLRPQPTPSTLHAGSHKLQRFRSIASIHQRFYIYMAWKKRCLVKSDQLCTLRFYRFSEGCNEA